jgi:hypothetical protein
MAKTETEISSGAKARFCMSLMSELKLRPLTSIYEMTRLNRAMTSKHSPKHSLEDCFKTARRFKELNMPQDSHQRAAEFHELAAHAHRSAAAHIGKGDHETGHEHSRQAMEHSSKAYQASQEAVQKSANWVQEKQTKK